ncbi:MAG TPA: hypothetical protein VJ249_03850 [Candidatus Bathyarchaeia archaeon]|nr:hypothetical protein [Candidatus Bathyarchaeia archaeon]
MPTLRSEFSIDQFEAGLQKLAHELPRFRKMSTEDMTLNFYYDDGKPRRISVQIHRPTGKQGRWGPEIEYWGFSIEFKPYLDSHHQTKITFASPEDKGRIETWLMEIMASEKPKPRFTLRDMLLHK